MNDLRTHITALKRRNALGQIAAGIGMGLCMVVVMAIVMGSM